ncbi:uncharacterized protein LOC141640020 [Silene latifolia]|uniref:uncharacterized protein LOC141640020 n=1 Tax=Silene latifolia TaxID=37657 RepID=UPI003D775821
MKVASWNVRGFNCPIKQCDVKDFLVHNQLDVLAILETRVKETKARKIISKCISCQVHHHLSSSDFQLSAVYGSNDASERLYLWNSLNQICTTKPWIVLGDFNVIRSPEEKLSSNPPILQDMLAFNSCLASCSLDDISSSGTDLTWTNKQDQQTRVWSKLDRVLINSSWATSFSSSNAHFHESGLSDHSLVVVTVFTERKIPKRFSFLNSWIEHPDYEATVKSAWKTSKADKVKTARQQLKDVQANLLTDPFSPTLILEEKLAVKEFTRLKSIEHSILQQRAKITHLQQTDTNSKFFFAKIAERRHQQFIGSIKDTNGLIYSGQEGVTHAFQDYFSALLGSNQPVSVLDADLLRQDGCVLPTDHTNLLRDVTQLEIKEAVFSIDSNSSPGINGNISGFFPGKIGIRQGDPLSPYLFVLSMEILSRGDVPSVNAAKTTLSEFALFFGLHANIDKTNIYFGGVSPSIMHEIMEATGFSLGEFPFRYLGLPLATSKLKLSMYDSLITKIQKCIHHWSSHALSYAGRDLLSWNQALLMKWVWKLSLPDTDLWALWIKTYALKQDSIWTVISKDQFPSCFRDILKIRDLFITLSGSAQQAQLQLNAWCAGSHVPAQLLYLFFRQITPVGDWATRLTYSGILPSHKIIASMAVQGQLATVDNLQQRGFSLANRCCLPALSLQQELPLQVSLPNWRKHWYLISIAVVVHSIWAERNRRIFAQERLSHSALLNKLKFQIVVRMHMRHSELLIASVQSD